MGITTASGYTNTHRTGAIAVVTGSSLWGLFWIPLRYMESLGINALWALAFVMAAALIPSLIMMRLRGNLTDLEQLETVRSGFVLGLATTLYFIALMYTDVIRVIFLFYLLPLWTTLAARLIYGEPINASRLLIMFIAFSGLWLLLSEGDGFPVPQSVGDWCAIASGVFWGISLSLLRADGQSCAYSRTLVAIASAAFLSLLAILFLQFTDNVLPSQATSFIVEDTTAQNRTSLIAVVAIVFGIFALYPAMIAQIWGASQIPAPTSALLTMSEIIVAIGSAAILIGTDMPPLAIVGGCIIILALCLDIFLQLSSVTKKCSA
ncbi:MAG: DMT family transporter [Granulosicoccus sp.]